MYIYGDDVRHCKECGDPRANLRQELGVLDFFLLRKSLVYWKI